MGGRATAHRVRSQRHLAIALAMLVVSFSQSVHVGKLYPKPIALDELIRRSTEIVIVEPGDPPRTEERVPVKARGKKAPPYVRLVDRYRVKESLRGRLAAGTAIEVIPAHDAGKERRHREQHAQGLLRHVVVDTYEPKAAPQPDEPQIVFLTASDGRFAYPVEGAAEALAMRATIERIIDETSRAASSPTGPRSPNFVEGLRLVLSSDKPRYRQGEAVRLILRLESTKSETVTLKGIRPFRSSANPPAIELTAPDGTAVRVDHAFPRHLPPELDNEQPIVIPAGGSVTLLDFNLLDMPASVRRPEDEYFKTTVERLAPELLPGRYTACGTFLTQRPSYSGESDLVTFEIE